MAYQAKLGKTESYQRHSPCGWDVCTDGILCRRPNGGTAILWNKSLNSSVFYNPDKNIIGVKVTISATEYNLINVHLPCCNSANKDSFLRHLGALEATYKLLHSPHVILAGDFNASNKCLW